MRYHQTCPSLRHAVLHACLHACSSVIGSNRALVNFPLRTFQSPMEGHHTSSSLGGAAMRSCPQVCSTDVCFKCAPKNSSSQLNPTDDY